MNNNLYSSILQYGQKFPTTLYMDPQKIQENLETFSQEWKPYNPRKKVAREGLSVTSLDGGLSGVPDLDSVAEYNKKYNAGLSELSFQKPTVVYPVAEPYLKPFEGHIGRTHFIRMGKGGHFPPHRDNRRAEVTSLRLFVPIENCNPPRTFFMLEREALTFEHGRAYFINTCMEHTVFSCYPSLFMVINIGVNDTTIQTLLDHMEWR